MSGTRWDAIVDGSITIPVNEHLGFELVPGGDPREGVTFTWTVPPECCNAQGALQGGMFAAFADAVLGGVSAAYLDADTYPALAEMKISIFRPAPAGETITGTGRIVKGGSRVLFSEAEITDSSGRLIAKASGTAIPAKA
ncbi:MAG TPA: PaaI family thioesterase [Actinomycetota bacterium]|nr:PaaI family thioesterase [Actinomycetota bacterium]